MHIKSWLVIYQLFFKKWQDILYIASCYWPYSISFECWKSDIFFLNLKRKQFVIVLPITPFQIVVVQLCMHGFPTICWQQNAPRLLFKCPRNHPRSVVSAQQIASQFSQTCQGILPVPTMRTALLWAVAIGARQAGEWRDKIHQSGETDVRLGIDYRLIIDASTTMARMPSTRRWFGSWEVLMRRPDHSLVL
jgi:hypothetical protein